MSTIYDEGGKIQKQVFLQLEPIINLERLVRNTRAVERFEHNGALCRAVSSPNPGGGFEQNVGIGYFSQYYDGFFVAPGWDTIINTRHRKAYAFTYITLPYEEKITNADSYECTLNFYNWLKSGARPLTVSWAA